jgi:hypothetical protein
MSLKQAFQHLYDETLKHNPFGLSNEETARLRSLADQMVGPLVEENEDLKANLVEAEGRIEELVEERKASRRNHEGATVAEIREELADIDDDVLTADGFDEALIGFVEIWGQEGRATVALYDTELCLQILMDRDGMDEETASEHFDFNVTGGYVGRTTPAYATIRRGMVKESADRTLLDQLVLAVKQYFAKTDICYEPIETVLAAIAEARKP